MTLYTRARCHLCEVAAEVLDDVREDLPFELDVVDIDGDDALRARYRTDIPVVLLDGELLFRYRVDADVLRARLRASESP
ncbi:MAG: glutaredoxin family protein [Polyangiales bacterium]